MGTDIRKPGSAMKPTVKSRPTATLPAGTIPADEINEWLATLPPVPLYGEDQ